MLQRASASIYSDELITATELNRQPGRVLDRAKEHPVTITRNDEYFALLPREDMAFWVEATKLSKAVFELILVAYRLRLGEQIESGHPYQWLKVFDSDELTELIAEVESAFRFVGLEAGAIAKVDAIIYEWRESAIAINSPELAAAFSDEAREVLLSQPSENTTSSANC